MASLFRGGEVEVCSKQDGFVGSYYAATVIREHGDNSYAVQYKNLLEEDESRPLIEVVDAEDARPVPPKVLATGFALYEEVDAFDNDGWWVGKISGRKGSKYLVFFDEYGVEIAYPSSQLRAHLEWVGGKWVFPKNRAF
ncbi:protein AGENET DOMAIN (AGD)-CONTAINING P1-like [Alnus glutinosa]|uniref:protein AGENET DOMAIN (AGD)-CONTAINING P1-like n=1 Tax=Alnus glutinosa TaxID=3517 RepID=UPI002D7A1704|nr:protein AGENET DOMAIN (AGD)-CONTAINING P1-like [Alnus glutinosa]